MGQRPSRASLVTRTITALSFALLVGLAWGVSSGEELRRAAERAINNLKSSDSALTNFFECSAGYVVFPSVRRSGRYLPEEHVRGVVYEKGKPAGEAVLTEVNAERQGSAAPFHEAIFFETAEALDNFKQGRFVISSPVSAVAVAEGAAATAKYRKGAVAFVLPKDGLLETIVIGEQKFSYQPQD